SLAGDPTFEEVLKRVKTGTLGAFANQDLPFERIVEELQPERSLHHVPFAHIMFALQNAAPPILQVPGASLTFEHVESEGAKFDLTLIAQETGHGLILRAEYNRDLYERGTMERFLEHFEIFLEAALRMPNEKITALPWMSESEQKAVTFEW